MQFAICFVGLIAWGAAVPHKQIEEPSQIAVPIATSIPAPTLPVEPSTSLNIPVTTGFVLPTLLPPPTTSTSRRRNPHSEPIPIFSKSCDCPNVATVAKPCWVTDALQKCNFEELHSWVCWTSANYGCPSPTRTCSNSFEPTPVTGRHPCELGPNPPAVSIAFVARR
ncbi:hypothetical protein CC78DRAFT_197504 [Lojkania enalia]|uniref:Uncharacterized protein n=1 Tax=Lojkania enalia TaxID=147567 RepID=A0A9P4TRB4_9PLEO|nr:hypothetical protein CC78DRAFT_197504 [Didymosphaeria enalia]